MACTTIDELYLVLDAMTEDEYNALTAQQKLDIEAKIAALTAETTPKQDVPAPLENAGELYNKLIATTTAADFEAIAAAATEDELNLTCEEFDSLAAHYLYLTNGSYPSNEPVSYEDERLGIVDFTDVAPLVDAEN